MKTRRHKIDIIVLIAFMLLAIMYVLDFNRIETVEKIEARGNHTGEDNMLSSLNVTAFAQDTKQRIWIGTSAGLNVYDGHNYLQFFHSQEDSTALPDDYINVIHRDRAGNMWVGTQNGLARYVGGYRFQRYAIPKSDDNISAIRNTQDNTDPTAILVKGNKQWYRINQAGVIGKTDGEHRNEQQSKTDGEHRYDQQNQKGQGCGGLSSARNIQSAKDIQSLLSDSLILQKPQELVSATFCDEEGNLWVGFHNAGYRVLSQNTTDYTYANANPLAAVTNGKDITSLERVGRHILAGTTLRLYAYDTTTGNQSYILYSDLFAPAAPSAASNAETVAQQEINNIVACGENKAWIINDRQIVSCLLSDDGLHIVAKTAPVQGANSLLGTGAKAGDALYVSSGGKHIVKHTFGSAHVERIPIASPWYGSDTQMTALHNGDLILFMRNMHVAILSTKTHQLRNIELEGTDGKTANIDPAFVRQDSYDNVWLGTRRTGLYRLTLTDRHVKRITFIDDVHIQGMVEDSQHCLWITTLKDAICYQPATEAILLGSLVSSRMNNWNRQYFDLAICLSPKGNVVLGSSDGCVFLPAKSAKSRLSKNALRIASMDIKDTDGRELTINDNITDGSRYTLSHSEKALTFRFFYPNYDRSSALMYQFMLEGYDQTWRQPTYKNTAYFANLTPGNYTFRVRLVSSPNLPPLAECNVEVRVKPAPWNSAAAWLLYVVALAAAGYYFKAFYRKMHTYHQRLQQMRTELETLRALRKQLGESVDTSNVGEALAEPDRKFMDELYAFMEKRASEQELNVQTVCRDLLISQTKFTYKLKQLTGDTPGTFFRKYKLNKAAQMLRKGDSPVNEIATLTGFGTPAHFSVAFKKQFGVTPSEYAKDHKEQTSEEG